MYRREVQPQSFQCQPRGQLPIGAHGYVDSILKDLKKCRRQLKSNFAAYREELEILERLYYKGKNQHSASLVWKRVYEARRYTQRVANSGITPFVDGLYLSFFDLPWTTSQKPKSSWSHYPATDSVALVSGRLNAISQLLAKCHSRLEEAYRHLTLAMQSGAFVQFQVLFIATISRIHALSNTLLSDLCQALSLTDQVISLLRDPPTSIDPKPEIVVASILPTPDEACEVLHPPTVIVSSSKRIKRDQDMRHEKPKKRKKTDEIDAIFGI